MKPIRISNVKFSILSVVMLAWVATSACSLKISSEDDKALVEAASNGDAVRVKSLLDQGADVDHQNEQGWSALRHAARKGHVEVAKVLLAEGAEVHHKAKFNKTALTVAKTPAIVQLLKAAGAK